MRKIELSHQKNIRDLGGLVGFEGKKVKSGRIYRGGLLATVNDEDIKIINSLHLTDIIDFRGNDEFIIRPDYPFVGVNMHNYPMMVEDVSKKNSLNEDSNLLWFLKDHTDGFNHMYKVYGDFVSSKIGNSALRKFFRVIQNNPTGVFYFHCSQGKDRAGIAAYLLEIALGVSKEDARADYMRSNEAMVGRVERYIEELKDKSFFNEDYKKSLFDVFSTKHEYLNHALEVIDEKYGNIENYLTRELKVDLKKLRALFLE